ncbi:hypothetical protein [Mycobacterium avium]|uniref:hypothetical protein n=1 Tax=Mycobacterium avium TaxID=1764 RepID=UPI0020D129CA|nr:hypothetical protein [Mycobacterium avium]
MTLADHLDSTYFPHEEPNGVLVLEPATDMSVAQAAHLTLPTADRMRIQEFLDDPSTAAAGGNHARRVRRRRDWMKIQRDSPLFCVGHPLNFERVSNSHHRLPR